MMELLAKITRLGLQFGIYTYEDLYAFTEKDVFRLLEKSNIPEITILLDIFKTIKRTEIPTIKMPYIKSREINPLVRGKRLK